MAFPDDLRDPTYALRRRVVDWALQQVGSHYLHGAWGPRPDYAGGDGGERPPYRAGQVRMHPIDLTPGRRFAHTAWWPNGNPTAGNPGGVYYCAGRCRNPAVVGRTPGDPRDARTDTAPPPGLLWPRYMCADHQPLAEVWGEPCMGVRHFDCITLVLMAFQAALGTIQRREIRQFGGTPGQPEEHLLTRNVGFDHIWTADVLTIHDHHIALATGDGKVVQAEDTEHGVTVKALHGQGGFTRCGRLPRGFWHR